MTIRLSTGLRNNMVGATGLSASFLNGFIDIYTGSQPVTADSPVMGTKLGTVSLSSQATTDEVRSSGTLTFSGTAGTVANVTVGLLNIMPARAVAFTIDLATTVALVAEAINDSGLFSATAASAVLTVTSPPGSGAAYNANSLAANVSGGLSAVSGGTYAGGVDAVAGLKFSQPTAGTVAKSGVWSFNGIAIGTAGWFRFRGSVADAGGTSTTLCRMDGSIAVSGGDMNLSNIAITVGAPTTIDTFTVTLPAA